MEKVKSRSDHKIMEHVGKTQRMIKLPIKKPGKPTTKFPIPREWARSF